MWRTLPVCAVLFVSFVAAQAIAAPPPNEIVIAMTVRGAAAPRPALKYQLLPELRDMNPGNPMVVYPKCFAEQTNFWRHPQNVGDREKWQTMPLHDLPVNQIKQSYNQQRGPLRYADEAARLDALDWQLLLPAKREGINLLLPDLQQLRELAVALKVRFRVEVAEQRYDDALRTAQTMFALSRHLSEHPTLIGDLVGIRVASLAIGPLDELIQQPDTPNLFWALTDLPQPFVDMRKALQGERVLMMNVFDLLDERASMSEAQMEKAVNSISQLFKAANLKTDARQAIDILAKDEVHIAAARRRLMEVLGTREIQRRRIEKFPALQVVLLDEKLGYDETLDTEMKAMALPYWQAEPFFLTRTSLKEKRVDGLLAQFASTCCKVKTVQARLDQRFGLLRCVEALRMYAAAHEGRLPAKLADMDLPLPVDAVSGKPFAYELKGKTAIVRGTPLPNYSIRYEVTIDK